MQAALKNYDDVDSWKTVMFLYNAALKEVGTKLDILNDEFQHVHQYNPIEYVKKRDGAKTYLLLKDIIQLACMLITHHSGTEMLCIRL